MCVWKGGGGVRSDKFYAQSCYFMMNQLVYTYHYSSTLEKEGGGAILDLGCPSFRLSVRPSVTISFLLNILRTKRSDFTN